MISMTIQAIMQKMRQENRTYIKVTNLLNISKNNSKVGKNTQIIILDIEIDTISYIIRLSIKN